MQKRFGTLIAFLAIATVTACNSTSAVNPSAKPSTAASLTPSTSAAVGTSISNYTLVGVNGDTAELVVPTGTGTITASTSASPPTGVTAITSVARATAQSGKKTAAATTTDTAFFYITVNATGGPATLNNVPGVVVTFPSAPSGSTYLAMYDGTQWVTTSAGTVNGNTVTYSPAAGPVSLVSGGALYLVVYSGVDLVAPSPSPNPSPSPTNVVSDASFASGTLATPGPSGYPAGKWFACTITDPNSVAAISTSSPQNTTEVNAIITSASSPPVPLNTAAPSPTAVPVVPNTGDTHAALTVVGTYASTISAYSAFNPNNPGEQGVCQIVTMPEKTATLTYNAVLGNSDTVSSTTEYVSEEADLVVPTSTTITTPFVQGPGYSIFSNFPSTKTGSTPPAYTAETGTVTGPAVGSTVVLFIGVYDSSPENKYGAVQVIDDVSFK